MAQPIILNANQINVLYLLGKAYGSALTFSNVRISSSGGALCDWKMTTEAWDKVNAAFNSRCVDIEASREDLIAYLDWFDRQEKDEKEFRSLFGTYRQRTQAEKNLFMFLKLAQAFNYPADIQKEIEETP